MEEAPDETMIEAPDSPPEPERSPTQSFAGQPSQPSNPNRVNGESGAKVNYGAPGSSWQTKKFHEEYDKMESQLLDKQWERKSTNTNCISTVKANWVLERYGDPLLLNRPAT